MLLLFSNNSFIILCAIYVTFYFIIPAGRHLFYILHIFCGQIYAHSSCRSFYDIKVTELPNTSSFTHETNTGQVKLVNDVVCTHHYSPRINSNISCTTPKCSQSVSFPQGLWHPIVSVADISTQQSITLPPVFYRSLVRSTIISNHY